MNRAYLTVAAALALSASAKAEDNARLTYDAPTLYTEFTTATPLDVMDKFMGKAVDLTGEVDYVGSAGNHLVLKLKTKEPKKFVMLDVAKGSKVKKGQKVAFACGGIGGAADDILQMTDCTLAKK
jgi:hypothetical protein